MAEVIIFTGETYMGNVTALNASDDKEFMPKKMHENLGAKFKDLIPSFAKKFPFNVDGTQCSYPVKLFDLWLQEQGFLVVPAMQPQTELEPDRWRPVAGAKSDAWIAHTQRRYRLNQDLNKAASHSRVRFENKLRPFSVTIQHERVIVRPVELKAALGDVAREVESLTKTKKMKLRRLLDSSDFTILPTSDRIAVKSLVLSLNTFEQTIQALSMNLSGNFNLLLESLRRTMKDGGFKPTDGAISSLLASEGDDADAATSVL